LSSAAFALALTPRLAIVSLGISVLGSAPTKASVLLFTFLTFYTASWTPLVLHSVREGRFVRPLAWPVIPFAWIMHGLIRLPRLLTRLRQVRWSRLLVTLGMSLLLVLAISLFSAIIYFLSGRHILDYGGWILLLFVFMMIFACLYMLTRLVSDLIRQRKWLRENEDGVNSEVLLDAISNTRTQAGALRLVAGIRERHLLIDAATVETMGDLVTAVDFLGTVSTRFGSIISLQPERAARQTKFSSWWRSIMRDSVTERPPTLWPEWRSPNFGIWWRKQFEDNSGRMLSLLSGDAIDEMVRTVDEAMATTAQDRRVGEVAVTTNPATKWNGSGCEDVGSRTRLTDEPAPELD
jgi:hypothetical protein